MPHGKDIPAKCGIATLVIRKHQMIQYDKGDTPTLLGFISTAYQEPRKRFLWLEEAINMVTDSNGYMVTDDILVNKNIVSA